MALLFVQHVSIVVVMVITLWTMSITAVCPSQCTCNPVVKSVMCSSAGYYSLTVGLPADTEHLVIRGSYARSLAFHHLTKKDLQIFPNLKTLVISHTQLTTVDRDAFSGVSNLKTLDLSFNQISKLEPGVFHDLHGLRSLILTGNEGCSLQPGVFQGLSSLKELYLGSMKLGLISSTLFMGLDAMEALDLSDNDIQKVPVDFIFPTVFQHLKLLDLSFNRLTELSHTLEPLFQRVDKVKLGDNPWHCTCTLLWLKKYPQHIVSAHGTDGMICNSPDRVKYQSLAQLADHSLMCVPPAVSSCEQPKPVKDGDSLTVKCHIAGDPTPEVSWVLPDGSMLSGKGDTSRGIAVNQTKDEVTLTVTATSMAWNGTLQIKLSNVEGISHSQVQIIVLLLTTTTTSTSTTTTTTSMTTTTTSTTAPTTSTTSTKKPTTTTIPRVRVTSFPQINLGSSTQSPPGSSTGEDGKNPGLGDNGSLQKTLIFGAVGIASVGIISAAVVGVVLHKFLSTSNKVKPLQVKERYEDCFSPDNGSQIPSSNVAPSSTRPVNLVMPAWE